MSLLLRFMKVNLDTRCTHTIDFGSHKSHAHGNLRNARFSVKQTLVVACLDVRKLDGLVQRSETTHIVRMIMPTQHLRQMVVRDAQARPRAVGGTPAAHDRRGPRTGAHTRRTCAHRTRKQMLIDQEGQGRSPWCKPNTKQTQVYHLRVWEQPAGPTCVTGCVGGGRRLGSGHPPRGPSAP